MTAHARSIRYRISFVKLAFAVLCIITLVATTGFTAGLARARANVSASTQAETDLDHLKMLLGKDFEIAFMSMMIEHHQAAIDMANMVLTQAKHEELKGVARNIISDQSREINEMTTWLMQWYNATPQHGMIHNMPGMDMGEMMALANLKGDAFDKQFLKLMTMHHQSAVEMARLVPDRATHTELKTLAQNIITTQSAEIQQFESWLMAWYNETATGAEAGGQMPPMTSSGSSGMNPAGMPRTGASNGAASLPSSLYAGLLLIAAILIAGVVLRKRA